MGGAIFYLLIYFNHLLMVIYTSAAAARVLSVVSDSVRPGGDGSLQAPPSLRFSRANAEWSCHFLLNIYSGMPFSFLNYYNPILLYSF